MWERKLNRLDVWNYDSVGYYYLTINTMHYFDFFGHIHEDNMELSEIGRIAHQCWIELPDHFNFISLDEFIIMPNHFHGIIKILPLERIKSESGGIKSHGFNMPLERIKSESKRIKVYGTGMPVPYDKNNVANDKNNAQYKKLPIIMGSYKSAVSKLAHKKGNTNFGWHKSYYDHIIRNGNDLIRIRKYISNNPANWNGNG